MPDITTLIDDIYSLFDKPSEIDPEVVKAFGVRLGEMLAARLTEQRNGTTLRLSNLGKPCLRQLWYECNTPELGEKLSGSTRLKFLVGDILEHVVLFLAEVSGHTVEYQQQEVDLDGVSGHIDALVDGELVDVKSASPYSFTKFQSGLKPEDDSFGYLTQLGGYAASLGHKRAHFLAAHKVLGTLCLDTHDLPEVDYAERVATVRRTLEGNSPPDRGFDDVPDGKSGNRKLGVNCSYCAYKEFCWPGVKAYGYSNGVRFLTQVRKEPKVDAV